jgi:hypothetical protein
MTDRVFFIHPHALSNRLEWPMRKQLATVATAGVAALATVGGVLVGASLGGPEQRTISATTSSPRTAQRPPSPPDPIRSSSNFCPISSRTASICRSVWPRRTELVVRRCLAASVGFSHAADI